MVSLPFVFWMFAAIFSIIGAMRGWAKELLVSFSVILGLFAIEILEEYVPTIFITLSQNHTYSQFWTRSLIIALLVFFGYETPNIQRIAGDRFIRERFQDMVLGFVLGALNGYLILGSIWYFLHEANYPFQNILAPDPTNSFGQAALKLVSVLPPVWMGAPVIYFTIAIAFVFVIMVFV